MGSLGDEIRKNIVEPSMARMINSAKGVIDQYDHLTNKAIIKVKHPFQEGYITYKDLELPLNAPGVMTAGPFRGDLVLIQYTSKNLGGPKVVAIIDDNYMQNSREERSKHLEQGTYIPDNIGIDFNHEKLTSDIVFDYYMRDIERGRRQMLQPVKDLNLATEELPFFNLAEVGITHPKTKSTVKLKDDGCIDLFSWLNQGIRISPIYKTILGIADHIKWIAFKSFKIDSKDKIIFNSITQEEQSNIYHSKTKNNTTLQSDGEINILSNKTKMNSNELDIDAMNTYMKSNMNYKGTIIYNNEELKNMMHRVAKEEINNHVRSVKHGCNC